MKSCTQTSGATTPAPSNSSFASDSLVLERVARALHPNAFLRADQDGMELGREAARRALEASHHAELVEALETARDLLLERIHGNPARSSGHNARVIIESALAKIGGDA